MTLTGDKPGSTSPSLKPSEGVTASDNDRTIASEASSGSWDTDLLPVTIIHG